MIFCRQNVFLPFLMTMVLMAGYQVNVFSQVSPYNPVAASSPQQPTNTQIPQNPGISGAYVAPANVPSASYGASGMPTAVAPSATGAVPTNSTGIAGAGAQPDHMINRPLGVMPNTTVPNGTQPVAMQQPGQRPAQTSNNSPLMPPNGRQICPPPGGYSPSQEELNYIKNFLSTWSEESKDIEAINYDFTRLKYTAHSQTEAANAPTESYGRVKYQAPDKGLFEIHSSLVQGKVSTETGEKQKIVCTGSAVYEFKFNEKKLIENVIPEEQRGKGTLDSPLMILVGANPQELQERFYLMALKPWTNDVAGCYCFRAYPKWPEDARDFTFVELAIDGKTFHARELRLFLPGGTDYQIYKITNKQINLIGQLTNRIFAKDDFDRNAILKSMPRGWTYETKTDFLPEASQQYVHQPNPSAARPNSAYGNAVNAPNNSAMPGTGMTGYPPGSPAGQPQHQPNMLQNVSPNQTQLSHNGTPMANSASVGVAPQFGVQQNQPGAGYYMGNPASQNQYMAMPPQTNALSPSVIR